MISEKVMDILRQYAWPGNIRELQNVMERAIILTRGSKLSLEGALDATESVSEEASAGEGLEDVEREHIRHVLEKTGWKIAGKDGAATWLRLNPSTLRSRIEKLGIRRPSANL